MMKKVFGMSYSEHRDSFILSVSINLHKFERGRPVGPSLKPGEDVDSYVSQFAISKRLLARVAMAVYDLSGFLIIAQMMNRVYFLDAIIKFVENIKMLVSLEGYMWPRSAPLAAGWKD